MSPSSDTRSAHVRFFEEISGGDKRQLWARHPDAGPTDDLVYIEEGQAEYFRNRGLVPNCLMCPLPGCPIPVFKTTRGGYYRDHFVHESDPQIDHYGPKAMAFYGGRLIAQWLRRQPAVKQKSIEIDTPLDGVSQVRFEVTGSGGGARVITFLAREPSAEELDRYDAPGTTWLLWNRRRFLARRRGHANAADATEFALRLARRGPVAWLSPDLRMIGLPGDRVDGNRKLELRLRPMSAAKLDGDGVIEGSGRNYFTAPAAPAPKPKETFPPGVPVDARQQLAARVFELFLPLVHPLGRVNAGRIVAIVPRSALPFTPTKPMMQRFDESVLLATDPVAEMKLKPDDLVVIPADVVAAMDRDLRIALGQRALKPLVLKGDATSVKNLRDSLMRHLERLARES